MRARIAAAAGVALLALAGAGCGSSSPGTAQAPPSTARAPAADPNGPEVNPSGDIPDDQAFVRYSPPGAGYSVKVPEGWGRTAAGGAVTFTDKLNAIRLETGAAASPVTVASVTARDLPKLERTVPGYRAGDVTSVSRSAGTAVRVTYLADSPADAVTGKSHTDAVERYVFVHGGRTAVLTLSGPQGADNVDPWMIVSDSLTWTR